MKKQINNLKEFQQKFNSTYNTEPTLLPFDGYHLRYKLLKEENEEYLEAAENNDLVEIADALGDQLYIVLGTIVSHGMQHIIEDVFKEIHASNLSKLDDEGLPIINGSNGVYDDTRPIGKILKSKNYFKPNIKQFLSVLILLLPLLSFCQTQEVYEYNEYGVRSLQPSMSIERDTLTSSTRVYEYNRFGIKDTQPKLEIKTYEYDDNIYDSNANGTNTINSNRLNSRVYNNPRWRSIRDSD